MSSREICWARPCLLPSSSARICGCFPPHCLRPWPTHTSRARRPAPPGGHTTLSCPRASSAPASPSACATPSRASSSARSSSACGRTRSARCGRTCSTTSTRRRGRCAPRGPRAWRTRRRKRVPRQPCPVREPLQQDPSVGCPAGG